MVDINVIVEDCFLDEILNELPNRMPKPTPAVKGKNLKTIFNQFSDSLKDIHLQYTCVDASSIAIALGTNVGNAYVYQRVHRKIIKISSETKYVPTTCIKLGAGCTTVAFGHESGTFSVGLVDPPIHKSFESLTAQDIHLSRITCLEWSADALILYAGDGSGNVSMSVVKISEGILQTAIIVTENSSVVQLSYAADALLISTSKRTVLWPFQTETLVQVGEKERKTSGGFGCCFMPDTLQEPTKKLYAARPGLRIWTADENGKVSSTSVFKSLLADKPPVIRTLIAHDDKANSNGQFGKLLVFYDRYVITWDQNHIWVVDLDVGNLIGCHSNLGKIRDVAVCGHEIFVLVTQRERFLRRFILSTERVLEGSLLDAVIAGKDEPSSEVSENSEAEKSGFSIASALMSVPLMSLESEESVEAPESKDNDPGIASSSKEGDDAAKVDIFEKINSISLDEEQGDIVFTAAKKKKKKKKPKASTPAEETETSNETQNNTESSKEVGTPPSARQEITANIEETPTTSAEGIRSDVVTASNLGTVLPSRSNGNEEVSSSERDNELESLDILDGKNAGGEVDNEVASHVTDQRASEENLGMGPDAANTSVNKESASLRENRSTNEATQQETTVHEVSITINTSTKQEASTIPETVTENEPQTAQGTVITENTKQAQETPEKQPEILKSDSLKEDSLSREDSSDSTDVYRSSDEAFHRLDSHEDDRSSSEKPDATSDKNVKPSKKANHVPLLPDTWSARALPTNQTIEHVAISEKYVFCVDNRNRVYFSDPNTPSSAGWEKANFTAKQIYVNSACDFICFVEKGKAFIRGNISAMDPVGNKSFQILDEVSQLATCSTCSWALTVGDSLKRADTAALTKLKGNLKSCSTWKHFAAVENLCQIACHNNVLWGRNLDEALLVYAGHSSGKKTSWKKEDKKAKWISMSDDGTLWIITPDDHIWFKQHVSGSRPGGEVWFQVTLGQYIIDDPSILDSTFNFFSSVSSAYRSSRATEYLRHAAQGLFQSTKDMACSLFRDGGSPKQICCNMQSGVWLLDTRNALHASRSQATGTSWETVCPTGTAKSATWRDVTNGLAGYVWAIQPNGDLTCFHPNGPAYNVECPSSHGGIDFISGSPYGVWCFASERNTKLYIRDGISESYPQGFAWKSSSLHQQEMTHIRHFSVGGITVWAVDNNGHVWVRLGSLEGEESNELAQAWLPIECDKNIEFTSVEVNGNDSMVWAVDTKGNVYARESVREDLIIGERWRQVEGVTLKGVCLSSYLVYGLSTTEEIVCRFGVSDANCVGDYWKKIPGSFSRISVNSAGELWAINEDEKLYARKMKFLVFSRGGAWVGGEEGKGVAGDGGHGNEGGDDIDEVGDWEML